MQTNPIVTGKGGACKKKRRLLSSFLHLRMEKPSAGLRRTRQPQNALGDALGHMGKVAALVRRVASPTPAMRALRVRSSAAPRLRYTQQPRGIGFARQASAKPSNQSDPEQDAAP